MPLIPFHCGRQSKISQSAKMKQNPDYANDAKEAYQRNHDRDVTRVLLCIWIETANCQPNVLIRDFLIAGFFRFSISRHAAYPRRSSTNSYLLRHLSWSPVPNLTA